VHNFHFAALFVAGTYYWEPLVAKLVAELELLVTLPFQQRPKLEELFVTESRRDLQLHQLVLEQFRQQLWHLRPAVLERTSLYRQLDIELRGHLLPFERSSSPAPYIQPDILCRDQSHMKADNRLQARIDIESDTSFLGHN
jgi:hypothetical protein|tara:strand:+ start:6477 stop:6899 length:423 start_codon:yes stop_codon:yes gene_type:complete